MSTNDDQRSKTPGKKKAGWTVGPGKSSAGGAAVKWLDAEAKGGGDDAHTPIFWFNPATMAWCVLLAAVSSTLVDGAIGQILLARIGALAGIDRFSLAGAAAAPVLFVGGLAAIFCGLWAGLAELLGRFIGRRWVGLFLFTLPLAALFADVNRDLFSGGAISAHRYVAYFRTGFLVVGAASIFFLVDRIERSFFDARKRRSQGFWTGLAALLVVAAFGLSFADAVIYPNGYPMVHVQMAFVAFALHVFAWIYLFAALEDRAPSNYLFVAIAIVVVASIGGTIGLLGRGRGDLMQIRRLASDTAYPLSRKVAGIFERGFLDKIRPIRAVDALDVSGILNDAFAADETRSSELDRVLCRERRQWNVAMIAIDTLRADAVGFLNIESQHRKTTPNLNRLARESIVFERAYTPYPTSNYAYSSIFTSFYPRWTPAREGVTDQKLPLPEAPNIAEKLKKLGFDTWAVTGLNPRGVADRSFFLPITPGFSIFNPVENEKGATAKESTAAALALLRGRDPEKRFFLFTQFFEPHDPYTPSAKFDFGAAPRALYDSEIAGMDADIAPLINELLRPPLRDNTIVVLFSDHGESFGEHNTRQHNNNLTDVETHVPFLVRIPGSAPKKIDRTVSLIDIVPTIESLLEIADTPRMGRDLTPLALSLSSGESWTDFAYAERFGRDPSPTRFHERSLVWKKKKIVQFTGDPTFAVFDLEKDPEELQNIANAADLEHRRLASLLTAMDRRIDGFFGGGRSISDALGDEGKKYDEFLKLLENGDPADDQGALIEVGLSLGIRCGEMSAAQSAEWTRPRLDRLRELLLGIAKQKDREPLLRQYAVFLLVTFNDSVLEPFMRELFTDHSDDPNIRMGSAFWLARRGIADGKDALVASLAQDPQAPDNFEWMLTAAPALAEIGHPAAASILALGLGWAQPEQLARNIRALGKIGYPDLSSLLRENYELGYPTWLQPVVERAMLEIVNSRTDDESTHLAARLSFSRAADVQTTARESLRKKLPAAKINEMLTSIEQEMLGDDATRDAQWEISSTYYERARKLLGDVVRDDFLKVKHARALVLAGKADDAALLAAAVLDDPQSTVFSRSHAAVIASAKGDAGAFTIDPHALSVKVEVVPVKLPFYTNVLFHAKIRVTNESTVPIAGGVWSYAPRFRWTYRDRSTGRSPEQSAGSYDIATFLPETGIAPGATLELETLGMSPRSAGDYIPILVLGKRPWPTEADRTVAELPELSIARIGN